jgi:hypothetical protein
VSWNLRGLNKEKRLRIGNLLRDRKGGRMVQMIMLKGGIFGKNWLA